MKLLTALKEKHDLKTLLFHSSWSLTLASGLSYGLGLLRDRILAQTYGLGRTLDVFNAAFDLPDMLYELFMGAMLSAAFLPIFIKQFDREKKSGYRYAHQIMSWGLITLAVICVMVGSGLPYATDLLVPGFEPEAQAQYILFVRILLISPVLFALSNLYGKMLLSFKEFLWVGLSPAFYNLGIVIGAAFLAPRFGTTGLMLGPILGVLMHMTLRLINVRRPKIGFRHSLDFTFSPELKETLKLTAPKIVQYGMWGLLIASFTRIASQLPAGSIAVYSYARNFQSIPVSLIGVAIALALYPSLSHDAAKGNFEKFKQDFRQGRARSLFYTTLAAIALALLSKPIISIFLSGGAFDENQIALLAKVLAVYCLAVPLESLMHCYHRAYYSLRNTFIPASLHTVIILATIIAAKILAPIIGIYAIPASFAGGLLVQIIILTILFSPALHRAEQQAPQQWVQRAN